MPSVPAPADPGRDGDPAWPGRDPMTAAEREAWLDRLCAQDDDPSDAPQEYRDPESGAPPPGEDELTAGELAGVAAAASDEMLGLDAASTGRRGPGQAGSARTFPGESASRAAGFGTGMAWDVTPGCAQLAVAADAALDAGGAGDSFGGVADHELVGLVCAFDRAEAYMAARKLVAIAEVFRRNPEDGFEAEPGRMPAVVHEFTRDQLALALGESRAAADWLLTVAWHLATRLAATLDALAGGIITRGKAELIVRLTQYLDGGEARGGGGEGPGPGRAADPRLAARRAGPRGHGGRAGQGAPAAGDRGADGPGGAVGRGLRQRRADGPRTAARTRCSRAISGSARGRASCARPGSRAGWMSCAPARSWTWSSAKTPGPAPPGPRAPQAATPPRGGSRPAGPGRGCGRRVRRAGHLTVPLGTAPAGGPARRAGRARPGRPLAGPRPAAAAARNPATTWCVTVTDQHGHAVGHGCARPEPRSRGKRAGPGPPGFSLPRPAGTGPPGGYGTWRLRVPGGGPDLIVAIDTLSTDPCQHQYRARGHDPGARLRHLSQVRHATCTSPVCRRPAPACDFEHNTPYEAGGRTCLCNGGPKCRHDHRLKQQPGWKVDQLPDGTFRWTTPAGRSYDTEPTRYPI